MKFTAVVGTRNFTAVEGSGTQNSPLFAGLNAIQKEQPLAAVA
jgi:hypothetical protein